MNKYQILEALILTEPESIKSLSKQGSKLALALLPDDDVDVLRFAELIQNQLGLKRKGTQYARKIIATYEYMINHFHYVTGKQMFEAWKESFKIYPASYK
ncbi:MAG: hypothetical protein SOY59_10510 [Ligilactobacillus agilis]|nr:hypothetical protein [Ligilactobacillus agilis]MDY4066056.1 hypothetical protein [Ligilactobacillus agilis]